MGREEDIGRKRRGKRKESRTEGTIHAEFIQEQSKNAMFRSLELKKYVIVSFFHKIIHENLA